MQAFWLSSGFQHLVRDQRGWLAVTPDWLRTVLARPELAPLEESGRHERRLYERLNHDPLQIVASQALARIEDADTRENYAHFLRFRDGLVDAGTLERYYLDLIRGGSTDLAPAFTNHAKPNR